MLQKSVCINSLFDYFYSFYIEGFIQLADEGLLCTSGLLRPTGFLDFDLRALHQFTTVACLMDNRRHAATTLSDPYAQLDLNSNPCSITWLCKESAEGSFSSIKITVDIRNQPTVALPVH